jgi:hypothetical protein
MDLIQFYRNAILSIGLEILGDDVIGFEGNPLKVNKKIVVLPTQENINKLSDGTITIFNPLIENSISTDPVLKKLLMVISVVYSHRLLILGDVIFDKYDGGKGNLPMDVMLLLGKIGEQKGKALKPFDKETPKVWKKLKEYITDGHHLTKFSITHKLVLNDKKVPSALVMNSPLLKEFNDDDSGLWDILKRDKDKKAFKVFLEYLVNPEEKIVGKANGAHSDFSCFVSGWVTKTLELNNKLYRLQAGDLATDLHLTIDDLSNLEAYTAQALAIPNNNDVSTPEVSSGPVGYGQEQTVQTPQPTQQVEQDDELPLPGNVLHKPEMPQYQPPKYGQPYTPPPQYDRPQGYVEPYPSGYAQPCPAPQPQYAEDARSNLPW